MAGPTEDEFRQRILDAARVCYINSPGTDRMHALIAQTADVSRPTVYKYVGDQDAIKRALMAREAARYVQALAPILARRLPLREHFLELVVFTVTHLRNNDLYQALLPTDPDTIIRGLTTDLAPLLAEGTITATQLLHQAHSTLRASPVPLELVIEWGIRISLSLLTTPSPHTPLDTPEALRRHVETLFAISGTPQPT